MPLRVALTHAFSWPEVRRGGERFLHELAGALARRGNDVTIIAGARRWSVAREDGVRVVRLPRGDPAVTFRAERWFGRLVVVPLIAGRFDVVHSLGARDAVGALIARRVGRSSRTVYTNLGLPLRDSWERRPDGAAHRRVVDETDVYGCLSAYARECLRSGFGREGATTPGGVRIDRFRPTVQRASEPTLLYSGALNEPRKNVDTLLESLAILSRSEPRVRLWLSGPGDPSALLADAPAAARERTVVLPLGSPDDQPDRYAAAWATVYPTHNEAFGLVLVESLACGTPIVASDHASLPELVEDGLGTIAPLGDPAALADACRQALDLSQAPGIRERCRGAAERHDWDRAVAPRIEALYLGAGRDAPWTARDGLPK
jgi:glycosyltransferase involved in cell wall biosynthesis